jgi:hypothetical protein
LKNIFFLLFPIFTFSQNVVQIKILDNNKAPIFRAIVIVSQNESQIEFGTTDINGNLTFNVPNGVYSVKFSKLGYVATIEDIAVDKNLNLIKILETEINKLETVIIKSRPLVMKVKKDTISYNLKAVRDGTENKIEDLIKKLPGLNVDDAGKVSYKGQQIGKVLIDGNDFFNNKHQMATQNIDAKMVDGIDLLLNHTGFSGENQSGQKIVALNLKMKSEFRNKWIGDFEIGGGINNATRLHNNLFKFFKKGNLAIIADYNSIAKIPITTEDYQEMIQGTATNNNDGKTSFEIPSFLNPNKFYTDKKNSFIGVNYTSTLSTKHKLTITNIFNNTYVVERQNQIQSQLGTTNQLNFSNLKNGSFLLNNTVLKWEFNKSKKTYINYVLEFTPNVDAEDNNVVTPINTISNISDNQRLSFAHKFSLNTIFFEKLKYNFSMGSSHQKSENKIDLANSLNIFDTNLNLINQNSNSRSDVFTINNNFTFTDKKNSYNLKIIALIDDSFFESTVIQDINFLNNANLKRKTTIMQPSWVKRWDGNWVTNIGFTTTLSNLKFNQAENTFFRFEPNLNVEYSLSGINKISLNYSLTHKSPVVSQLLNNFTFDDFQTRSRPSNVNFNLITPSNNFSINYLNINLISQSVLFFNVNYSLTENVISNNVRYAPSGVENQFIVTDNSKLLSVLAYYDLKFNKLPFSIKNTLSFMDTNGISQFDGLDNVLQSKIIGAKNEIISNFKNSNLQFDLGVNFNQTNYSQSVNSFNNTTTNFRFFFKLRGKASTIFKWDIQILRDKQNSGISSNVVDFLNFNSQYNLTKSMKFILNGFNILNLANSTIINANFNNSFFTETRTDIMPGFIMAGVNYSF